MNVARQNVFYHTVQDVFRSGLFKDLYLFLRVALSVLWGGCHAY